MRIETDKVRRERKGFATYQRARRGRKGVGDPGPTCFFFIYL